MAHMLLILSAVFLLLATHPFVTYPLSLYAIRRWHFRPLSLTADTAALRYALCVCAYNEEDCIAQKVENMLALRQVFPDLEILVYVDAATDQTAAILKQYENRIHVHYSPERQGKAHGMNILVSRAQANIVIFTDANVMFDTESFAHLPRYFADPQVGCVCGHLTYVNGGTTATATNGALYWRLEEHIKQLESDTGSLVCADGSVYAVRRQLYQTIPDNCADDMFVSMSILCENYRVVRASDILAYEESVTSAGEEFNRKIRIACMAFNTHRTLWPRLRNLGNLDLYKYVSHKLLRWFVIFWLALAVVSLIAGMSAAGGAELILFGCAALALGGIFRLLPIIQLIDILRAFTGTGIGVLRSLRGSHFRTWTPAASIRGK